MRPEWKNAPEWASWVCQDSDGRWVWFQYKPRIDLKSLQWINGRRLGEWEFADDPDWTHTLERRP